MQEVKVHEREVREAMEISGDSSRTREFDKELVELQAQWLQLSEAYTRAIGVFMDEVEAARQQQK